MVRGWESFPIEVWSLVGLGSVPCWDQVLIGVNIWLKRVPGQSQQSDPELVLGVRC